jgi:hypothetical protein
MRQMAQALVDKYNEDHHLLGVCSLPLPPSAYWVVYLCVLFFIPGTFAYLIYTCFRISHMNSKMFWTSTQFLSTSHATIISISVQILKQPMIQRAAPAIYSLRKSNFLKKGNIENCLSAVSAQSIQLLMVLRTLLS